MNVSVDKLSPCIDVVLAACNGQEYIQQQIESIQHCEGYTTLVSHIFVLDDISNDSTAEIVVQLAAVDSKIIFIANDSQRLGCAMNFARGLELSTAPYVMFCDQDDVWLPEKLRLSVESLQSREQQCGADVPVLLFSDLKVVDTNLNVMAESFWAYQRGTAIWSQHFKQLLVQNVAPGCTMIFNRALINKAIPLPAQAIMHDWWLLLVARAFGEVLYLPQPLGLYRQHGGNQVGAQKQFSPFSARFFSALQRSRFNLYRLASQAEAFYLRYGDADLPRLASADRVTLHTLIALPKLSAVQRLMAVLSGKIRKNNLYRNLGLILVVLLPVTSGKGK